MSIDLARLDRDVATAAAALRDAPGEIDWEDHRHVSGQRALGELASESPSLLRDALASWVAWLTAARISQPMVQRAITARAASQAIVRVETDVRRDLDAVIAGMIGAKNGADARAYFGALPEATDALREPERSVRDVREEAFRRLGIDDVGTRFMGVLRSDLAEAARELLMRTSDVARSAVRAADPPWPIDLDARLAHHASEGWPSRLSWRNVASLMPGLRLRGAPAGEPPIVVGAASFVRALVAIAEMVQRSWLPSAPFVVREPPLNASPHRTAFVVAAALGEPAFHARILGLSTGRARDQSRELRVAFLLDAQLAAFRVAASARGADIESLGALAFGAPLDARTTGVWPSSSDDDLARFHALLGAHDVIDALRSREGDDWFRNPRAWDTLRDLALAPPNDTPVIDRARSLAKRFEEVGS